MENQSALTQDFDKNWAIITNEFKRQKEMGLFPYEYGSSTEGNQTITEEGFQKTLDSLHDEKFTIAVCGVVKAGKSTFLNSLLFGNNILPTFDTPMTAKLTFIEYTDKANYATITFYSKEEWTQLNNDLKEKFPEQCKELEERMEICFSNHGISKDMCIGAPDKELRDLNLIEEYVTDQKTKGGKYTPFVKCVHIYVKNDSIRNLRIVDTPGLNDPNIINSLETEKWIRNTHALIFLLQNKGMSESDLQFFDVHLSGTKAGNRLFVINKIDDLDGNDWEKTRNYLKGLGKTEEFIRRGNLFGDKETICGYSALLSMLKNMKENGCPLDEDQEWALEDKEGFNPDPDNIAAKLSAKLYSNTGEKRIAAGVGKILHVYKTHVEQLEKTILEAGDALNDCGKSMEELEQEMNSLNQFRKNLMNKSNEFKDEVNRDVLRIMKENIVEPVQRHLDKIFEKILSTIMVSKDAKSLQGLVYTLKNECDRKFGTYGDFMHDLGDAKDNISDSLRDASNKVNNTFAQQGIAADVDCSLLSEIRFEDLEFDSISGDIEYELAEELPSNWLTSLFTKTSTMQSIAKAKFQEAKTRIEEELINDKTEKVRAGIITQVNDNFNRLNLLIKNKCDEMERIISSDKNNREEIRKNAKQKLDDATRRRDEINDARRSFDLHLPQQIKQSVYQN